MRPTRPGPQGLPRLDPPARETFYLHGQQGQRLLGSTNATYGQFTVVVHFRQTGTTVANPHLWAKYEANPGVQSDATYRLYLSGQTTLKADIFNGSSFVVANTVSAPAAVLDSKHWNFAAGSWDGVNNTICLNGAFSTNASASALGSNGWYWCAGNCSVDNTAGGANASMFNGMMWRPRLYNVAKNQSQLLAMAGGFDDRQNLVEDFLSVEVPPQMRYRRG